MALKALLENTEGLDEAVAALYVQKDGQFVLDVEGVNGVALEDVGALKKALGVERTARKKSDEALKPYKLDGEDGYLDPVAAGEAIVKVAEFANLDPEKEAGKRADLKITAAKKAIIEEWTGKVKTEVDRNERIMGQLGKVMVDNEVLRVLSDKEVKGNSRILLPLMRPNIRVVEEEDAFKTVVYGEDGEPLLNGKGDPATIKEYVQVLRDDEELAGAFGGSEHSGGGGGKGDLGGGGRKTDKGGSGEVFGQGRIARELEKQGVS